MAYEEVKIFFSPYSLTLQNLENLSNLAIDRDAVREG